MAIQFIVNDQGEKKAVIIPINVYENLLHQRHVNMELSDEYRSMIDNMIDDEITGKAKFVSAEIIKKRFLPK
jgi:hypothetical protein